MGYKIITKEDYYSEGISVVGVDDAGNDILMSKWQVSNPKARFSSDGSEAVLSNAGDLTQAEVLKYISDNWPEEIISE